MRTPYPTAPSTMPTDSSIEQLAVGAFSLSDVLLNQLTQLLSRVDGTGETARTDDKGLCKATVSSHLTHTNHNINSAIELVTTLRSRLYGN